MADNTIEVKITGAAGGGGQPPPPAGSRQAGDAAGGSAVGVDAAEERDRANFLRQYVQQRRAAEEKIRREQESADAKNEREKAEFLRQYVRQQREAQQQLLKAEADERKKILKAEADEKRRLANEERKAKEAEAEQRQKYIQASNAAQQISASSGAGGKVSGLVNLAQTGFLGGEAAALAGGPVGGMIVAAGIIQDAVNDQIKKSFAGLREGIQGVSTGMQQLAGNDYLGAAAGASEAVASGLEKAGVAGTVAAEVVRTGTAALQAFNDVLEAFVKRARELEQYNSQIAAAGANADVRRTQADIREANRQAEAYATIVDSQSRLEQSFRSVFEPIKELITEAIAGVVEPIASIAEDTAPIRKVATTAFAEFAKLNVAIRLLPLQTLAKVINLLFGWLGGEDEEVPDVLNQIQKALDNARADPNNQAAAVADRARDAKNRNRVPNFFGR